MAESKDYQMLPSTSASSSTTPPVKKKPTVGEWVMGEVLDSKCHFASYSSDVHTDICGYVDPNRDLAENNWVMSVLDVDEKVCKIYPLDLIPMYEIIFREMGLRVPFTDFQIFVFNHLELAPSQLLPNSVAFLWAFELTCQHLNIGVTVSLLFYCFTVQHKMEHARWGWVFLK